jgi:putative addiction module antidote
MVALKARRVGNSTGVTFPKQITDRLKIKPGDTIYLTESPVGYHLTIYDPEFAANMTAAEEVMRRYKDALRHLGK